MKVCGLLRKIGKKIWGFFPHMMQIKLGLRVLTVWQSCESVFVIPLLKSVQLLVELPREAFKQDNIELEAIHM